MTTESPTYIETTQLKTEAPVKDNTHAFLGLYFPSDLKAKVQVAAKAERRSMSQFMVMVTEKHFNNK